MRSTFVACLLLVTAATLSRASAEDDGLLLHYTFDGGRGATAQDRSGNGHHGRICGAKFVPHGDGFALRFHGGDDRVECDAPSGLAARKALTIALWIRPDSVPAGEVPLMGKDKAYSMTLYQPGDFWFYLSGTGGRSTARSDVLTPMDVWHHVAATFDGKEMNLYLNGQVCRESHPCRTTEISAGGELRLGRITPKADDQFEGLVGEGYRGLMDDVRIYDRALSARGIEQLLEKTRLQQIQIKPHVYYFGKQLIIGLDSRSFAPRAAEIVLELEILKQGRARILHHRRVGPLPVTMPHEERFEAGDLQPGTYVINARAFSLGGRPIGRAATATFRWPDPPRWPNAGDARVLNALVTELLRIEKPERAQGVYRFLNPRHGWVFARSKAQVAQGGRLQVRLDPPGDSKPLLMDHTKDKPVLEAMRLLPAGSYQLRLDAQGDVTVERLIVRAIPELIFAKVPGTPHVREYGVYDWKFLAKDVLPNVNVVLTGAHEPARRAWKEQGKKCIHNCRPIGMGHLAKLTPQQGAAHYAKLPGLSDPSYDGLIADEFGYPGDKRSVLTTKALRILQKDWHNRYAGRRYDAYTSGGAMHYGRMKVARDFLKVVTECGGHMVHERYLHTYPDEIGARAFLDTRLTSTMIASRRAYSGAERTMTICLGYFSAPPESLGLYPDVDYRVYLDMQFWTIATQADFFGLHGVMTYLCTYADEEVVRWAGRLMRHYCIEGRAERFTSDPYKLAHLVNGDFSDGTRGWQVSAADPGSVCVRELDGFGALRGNWTGGNTWQIKAGDTSLVTKRSAEKPNTISQTVKALKPGRAYSLRFFTADYGDMKNSVTAKKKLSLSAKLSNVDSIPEKSFLHLSQTIHSGAGFSGRKKPAWLNFHRIVFRAKGTEARLTLSDWAEKDKPAGPAGQEVIFNFIQIQPYLED